MSVRSFKSVGWVAAIGSAVLGCYMVSSRVAAERAEVDKLDRQIIAAERSIRALSTELGTRGRMTQLQHWASADFGFAPPAANQFVDGEVRLAELDMPQADTVQAPVQMASAAPAPRAEASPIVRASAPERPRAETRPAAEPRRTAEARPAAERPLLHRAAATRAEPGAVRTAAASPRPSAEPAATRAAARTSSRLIDERTLRDITSRSRAERAERRDR